MSLEHVFHEVGHTLTKPIHALWGHSILGIGILAGLGYLAYRGIRNITSNTRSSIAKTLGTV